MNKKELKRFYKMDDDEQAIFICNHKKQNTQKQNITKKIIKKFRGF